MPGLALIFNAEYGDYDLTLGSSGSVHDIAGDSDLLAAVIISLFTNRRAPDDELDQMPDGTSPDPQGWWGDWLSLADMVTDEIGSLLWLLWREKDLDSTLARAEAYAKSALAWLLSDAAGVLRVSSLSVSASRFAPGVMIITVSVKNPDGSGGFISAGWNFLYNYKTGALDKVTAI